MKNVNHPSMSLFSLILLLPIFISFGAGGNVGLGRIGAIDDAVWLVSLPFSVFISAYLILINIKNIFKSGVFKILLLYFIFILIMKYLYFGTDYQMIKVMGWMLIFISSTYSFRKYFEKRISIHNVMNAEKYYIFYPLLLILLISLLGFFVFNLPKDSFLISEIKVYSYSQYFAFVFILLLGSSSRSSFSFIVVFTLVVLISYTTKNTTALILAILLACYFFADKIFTHRLKRVFRNIILVAVFSLIIFYFSDIYTIQSDSIILRKLVINKYISQFDWIQAIFPFLNVSKVVSTSLHNEFLEIFSATGYLGFFIYYYFIISCFYAFNLKYRVQSIALLLVIALGGLVVVPTLHSYTVIALSYFSALYYSISNIIPSNQLLRGPTNETSTAKHLEW